MKLSRITLALVAVLGVLVAAGCGGSESVPDDAVAVVDGSPVARAELDGLLSRAKLSFAKQKREFPKAGTAEYQALQNEGVAFLVRRLEYELEAKELGVDVTNAAVDKRIADVKKEYYNGSQERFEKQLKDTGYTLESFKQDLRANMISEALYTRLTKDAKVTDKEIATYYEQNKSQYVVPDSRDVRHILVATKAEADNLYDQLKGGADFAVLAKSKSKDTGSAQNGGKLTITRGQTVEAFDKTAFLLTTNQLSRPVKTEFGYHLIQPLTAVKEGSTTPLSKVKATIRTQLQNQKSSTEVQTWIQDLEKKYESKVSYADGYAPPEQLDQSVTAGQTAAP